MGSYDYLLSFAAFHRFSSFCQADDPITQLVIGRERQNGCQQFRSEYANHLVCEFVFTSDIKARCYSSVHTALCRTES